MAPGLSRDSRRLMTFTREVACLSLTAAGRPILPTLWFSGCLLTRLRVAKEILWSFCSSRRTCFFVRDLSAKRAFAARRAASVMGMAFCVPGLVWFRGKSGVGRLCGCVGSGRGVAGRRSAGAGHRAASLGERGHGRGRRTTGFEGKAERRAGEGKERQAEGPTREVQEKMRFLGEGPLLSKVPAFWADCEFRPARGASGPLAVPSSRAGGPRGSKSACSLRRAELGGPRGLLRSRHVAVGW